MNETAIRVFTTTSVVAEDVHPLPSVTTSVYVPAIATVEEEETVGLCIELVNESGPLHTYEAMTYGPPVSSRGEPSHTGELLVAVAIGNATTATYVEDELVQPLLSVTTKVYIPAIATVAEKETVERSSPVEKIEIVHETDKDFYMRMVSKAKEYIAAGDIFQANLSVRLEMDFEGSEFKLYQNLKKINPSPFAGYINFGDIKIVSSSPERLIVKRGDKLQTRPIAGTRRRGKTKEEDNFFKEELLLSEKERAEHIMLVDLERNDLGRICKFGSVKVDELMVLEQYSHVTHIVSNVAGVLNDNITLPQIIRAVFPGGTITGTPKVRSMEVIAELEPTTRGIYTGSMGYLSYNGNLDLNIIIRTVFIFNGKAYVQAGAGIVADSIPHREYKESLYKAEALIEALKEKKIQG